MSNVTKLIHRNRVQLLNYIAVDIAEHFTKLPNQGQIHFIESMLHKHLNLYIATHHNKAIPVQKNKERKA